VWADLAKEKPVIENYLVLEDDVKFQEDWVSKWDIASQNIPEDYDILYLGGVLPPNRQVFFGVLEKVNDNWARVSPNQIFGQKEPTRYFHFCNYSYIIRRETAVKILQAIEQEGGYITSADHMICNRINSFKHYVMTPQVTGCYQDDDPKYATSEFNNFNRVDGFDSDLWNNDERFSGEEIQSTAPLDIAQALKDAFKPLPSTPLPSTPLPSTPLPSTLLPLTPLPPTKRHLYTIEPNRVNTKDLLEREWLTSLMGDDFDFTVETLAEDHKCLDNCPMFLVQRPHVELYNILFIRYKAEEKSFAVLHLSDEYLNDDITFYDYSTCKAVIRNYPRDLSDSCKEKVLTVPLGYYRHAESRIDAPWVETPGLAFREKIWTFYGTEWKNRQESMKPLLAIQPSDCKFYNKWLDSSNLQNLSYVGQLLNSIFVPCPTGMNPETFRFYEAIEHGAIPIYVRTPGDEKYVAMLQSFLPILNLPSWEHATIIMHNLNNDKNMLDMYRNQLLSQWTAYKNKLKEQVKGVLTAIAQ
jgi:hypothetical protein